MSLSSRKISIKKSNYHQCLDNEHECRIRRVDLSFLMNYLKTWWYSMHSFYSRENLWDTKDLPFYSSWIFFFSQRVLNLKTHTLLWMFYISYNWISALNLWSHFLFSKYLHNSDIWVKVTLTANLLFIKDTKLVWHEEVLERQSLNFTGDWQRRFHTQG